MHLYFLSVPDTEREAARGMGWSWAGSLWRSYYRAGKDQFGWQIKQDDITWHHKITCKMMKCIDEWFKHRDIVLCSICIENVIYISKCSLFIYLMVLSINTWCMSSAGIQQPFEGYFWGCWSPEEPKSEDKIARSCSWYRNTQLFTEMYRGVYICYFPDSSIQNNIYYYNSA